MADVNLVIEDNISSTPKYVHQSTNNSSLAISTDKIGVGTTTPTEKFEVNGNIRVPLANRVYTTQKIFNVLDYGASTTEGSGSISATSNPTQLTLTSAGDFTNGQRIIVVGAGADGAILVTRITAGGGTTTLTIANSALTTVSNTKILHDNKRSIQNAINDAVLQKGTVYLPRIATDANATISYAISGITGTVSTASATQLIDSTKDFNALGVTDGDVIFNMTKGCAAVVSGNPVSATTLNLALIYTHNSNLYYVVGHPVASGLNQFDVNDSYCVAGLVIKNGVHLTGPEGINNGLLLTAYGSNAYPVITADPRWQEQMFRISNLTITHEETTSMQYRSYGDTTTQISISNTSGSIWRYTYVSGTNPNFVSNGLQVRDTIVINSSNFNAGNNGVFTVTAVTATYFEVTNSSGVAENNKLLSTATSLQRERTYIPWDTTWMYKRIGGATTQLNISNPSGNTWRYTWNTVGTNPDFIANAMTVGNQVIVNSANLNRANNGTFTVTAVTSTYFEVTNVGGVVQSNIVLGSTDAILSQGTPWMYKRMGDNTTQFNITNPSGTTWRYTWNTVGTNPNFVVNGMTIGNNVIINSPNFAAGNNGTFVITTVAANYFEVTNSNGSAQSNISLGSIDGMLYQTLLENGVAECDYAINAYTYQFRNWVDIAQCNFVEIRRVTVKNFSVGIRLSCWTAGLIDDSQVFDCQVGIALVTPGGQTNSAVVNNCELFNNRIGIKMAGYGNKVLGGQIMNNSVVNATLILIYKETGSAGSHVNVISGVALECSSSDMIGINIKSGADGTIIEGCWFNLAAPGTSYSGQFNGIEIKDESSGRTNTLANYQNSKYWSYDKDLDWQAITNLKIKGMGASYGYGGRVSTNSNNINSAAMNGNASISMTTISCASGHITVDNGQDQFHEVQVGWQIRVNNQIYTVIRKDDLQNIYLSLPVSWASAYWEYRPNANAQWRRILYGVNAFEGTNPLVGGYQLTFVTPAYSVIAIYKNSPSAVSVEWDNSKSLLTSPVNFTHRAPVFNQIPLYSAIHIYNDTKYIVSITDEFNAMLDSVPSTAWSNQTYGITPNDAAIELIGGIAQKMNIRANMSSKNHLQLPGIYLNRWTGVDNNYSNARIGMENGSDGYDLALGAGSGTNGDKDTVTEALRVTNGGKIGIGTATPSEKLEISQGAIKISKLNTPTLLLNDTNNGNNASMTNTAVGTTWNGSYAIKTNSTDRLTVLGGGNVGIGLTNPAQKLDVSGMIKVTGNGNGIILTSPNGTYTKTLRLSNSGTLELV